MNLRGWVVGLIVAVVSAIADAGVLFLVAPEVLNDWRKFGTILGFAALKGFFLYLKTSPLDKVIKLDAAAKVVTSVLLTAVLVGGFAVMTGCEDWERSTYQTLAASQKVVNQARDDYRFASNHSLSECQTRVKLGQGGCIANTAASYKAINEATDVQTAAVEAFAAYERVKIVGTAEDVAAKQKELAELVVRLPAITSAIRALYSGGGN